jgi:phage terminase large subunit
MEIENSYVPNAWQSNMHRGHWLWGALVGGKGSGKTRSGTEELKACALEYPKTTWLIGRKTLPSLKDTTWREFVDCLPQGIIKEYNKTDRVVTLINDSIFLGRSLDEPKKLESLTLSGFLIDEAEEIEKMYFDVLKTRVRQILRIGGKKVTPRYRGILCLNPCDEDHWIPQLFTAVKPKDHAIFYSSTYDNMENLPDFYIENLKQTYTEDMQQRMIHGQFGRVHKGRPVFPEFQRGNFIFDVKVDEKLTIFRGWDFGYNNPACVWMQFIDGQVRVLAEKKGSKIYLDDFIRECRDLERELFPGHLLWRDFCDPHGSDETDKGKTSVDILNDAGIFPLHRRTKIQEGIKAIRECLNSKNKDGQANFIIHPRCRLIIEGMRGGYHREDGEDDPVKDNYYDHTMDAMRYCVVSLVRRHRFNKMASMIESKNIFTHPVTGRRIEL